MALTQLLGDSIRDRARRAWGLRTKSGARDKRPRPQELIIGGGEMGRLVREFDWSNNPLGSIDSWPASLRTAVSLVLNSSLNLMLIWGPEHIQIYNDAFTQLLASRKTSTLGKNFVTWWEPAFEVMEKPFRAALAGRTGLIENQHVSSPRGESGLEEMYITYSYSAVRDEEGAVAGLFVSGSDTTGTILGERRTRTLQQLSANGLDATSLNDALRRCARCLADAAFDLPFALFYRLDADRRTARLVAHAGLEPGGPASPRTVDLTCDAKAAGWPLAKLIASGTSLQLDDLRARFGDLVAGPYPEPLEAARLYAIPGGADRGGFTAPALVITGLSTRLPRNDAYLNFHEMLRATLGHVVASALSRETQQHRVEALASLDQAKSAFFSNVSHEFRTPLTLLLGPLEDELRQASESEPEVRRARLSMVHRNAQRLLELVNALLDFASFDAGRSSATFEPTDLAGYTAELAGVFRSAIERAGLTLTVDCPPLGTPVFVDPRMWERVVFNLLANAFKHTFGGEIRVSLRAVERTVELEVADTGVGIPAAELPRLFERFHRVRGLRGRTHEGTGIGLALVQDTLRLHGGLLRVSSHEGQGSCFTATLPTGSAHLPADQVAHKPTARAEDLSRLVRALPWLPEEAGWATATRPPRPIPVPGLALPARARILWAEDNADLREYVRRLLDPHYDVVAVADGAHALAIARATPPDLILSDVMMPELDGLELLRAVRADSRAQHTPVILLSARASAESAACGLDTGADDYLIKPFTAGELLARVRTHLALAKARRELTVELEHKVDERTLELTAAYTELREHEQRFRQLAAALQEVFWIRDSKSHRMLYVSPAYERIWMRTCESLYDNSLDWFASVHPDDRERVMREMSQIELDGRGFDSEFRIFRQDGSLRWIRTRGFPIVNQSGAVFRTAGIADDITDRKHSELARNHLEWQLRQSQKLESLGTLAGGIAHDFNNMLTAILGHAELARAELGDRHDVLESIDEICTAGQHAKDLVQRLLAFSRPQPPQRRPLHLLPLVEEAVRLMRPAVPAGVELSVRPEPGLPAIQGDASLIHQVLLNLTTNAWHALEGREGCIEIRLAARRVDGTLNEAHPELSPGAYVRMSVSDTGAGMVPATIARIFEPFFTTKPPGSGTGLGLSMVHGIVRSHGGAILVDSQVGHGSTFHVYWPASAELADADPAIDLDDRAAQGQGERILFIDDEASLAKLAVLQLERLGYRVEAYTQPAEALAAFRARPQRYDVVITDYNMPQMSGLEVAQQLLRIRPDTLITLSTGYMRPAELEKARTLGIREIILKPFNLEEFGSVVRRLLSESPRAEPPPARARARDLH